METRDTKDVEISPISSPSASLLKGRVYQVETAAATIRFTTGDSDESDSQSEEDDVPVIENRVSQFKSNAQNNLNSSIRTDNAHNNVTLSLVKELSHEQRGISASSTQSVSGAVIDRNCDNCHSYTQEHSTITSQPENVVLSNTQGTLPHRGSVPRFNPFDRDHAVDDQYPHFPVERVKSPSEDPTNNNTSSGYDTERRMTPSTSGSWPDSPVQEHDEADVSLNAELGLAEDHFCQPEGHFGLSSVEELEMAINNCKLLIFEEPEKSDRRKNLVNKLIHLRLKLQEAKEGPIEEDPDTKQVVGHHFKKKTSNSSKHYCEKCCGSIWGVLQAWYKCSGCGFCCHTKCLNQITRTCASAKVAENPQYILNICPEKGLGNQNYKCVECKMHISNKNGYGEPRQCDYTGNYYCESCHWNDTMVIPARLLHNWDLQPRKVCRASKQFLKLMLTKPVIRIHDINPMLFSFVEELNDVKKLREEILVMKRYFVTCQAALNSKLLLQLQLRQHFVDSSDMYSLQDLLDVAYDVLLPELAKIHTSFAQHIKTDCQLCQAKGWMCELCDAQEVLFPFDNIALVCPDCSTVLHRHCYMKKNRMCPKCERLNRRAVSQSPQSS